jgi:hypothetical protein
MDHFQQKILELLVKLWQMWEKRLEHQRVEEEEVVGLMRLPLNMQVD